MKEILRNMIQKVQRECNRRENKRRLMSMVAMLCVFSIVSTSVMQSSMIQVAANARTGSNAIETSSNVATPSDADNDVSGGMTGGTSSGMAEVQTPSNTTEVQTSSNATVATSSNATYEGILICGIDDEGHVHEESCYCTDVEAANVILMIHELPTADEIDAILLAYEDAEDWEGYEEYFVYIGSKGRRAYEAYEELTEEQKALVFNIDKLMEWSYLWSAAPLIDDITSDEPKTTWYTSTKDFIELNLYDYDSDINDYYVENPKYPGFQWNGGAYAYSGNTYSDTSKDEGIENKLVDRNEVDGIDFGNSMISNFNYGNTSDYGKSINAKTIGVLLTNTSTTTGAINRLWGTSAEKNITNRPVGMSVDAEVMYRTLKNGYPALADGTSLSYLFGDETADKHDAVVKKNTATIDGLFQQDSVSGAYSYNSRTNHAQYSDNFFTLYEDIITPNFIVYPFGNFLPLNSISNLNNATQVGKFNKQGGVKTYIEGIINDLNIAINNNPTSTGDNKTRTQLITMLEEYRENWKYWPYNSRYWNNITAADAIADYFVMPGDNPSENISFLTQAHLDKMYNIDWDVRTNFFFGMDMTMNFMQPKDGYTGNDTNQDGKSDYPMEFYFTGDDDVWVYIDGVLFLDLTGIHRHVGGEIDFVNGEVRYYELDTEGTGDVSTTPYKTYTFAELLTAAGKSTAGLNSKGTFKDYTTHEFKFYYLERGSGSSVCRLNFNFPLLKQNTISVEKELSNDSNVVGNPDYSFQILTADSNGDKTSDLFIAGNTEYKLYDADGNEIKKYDDNNNVIAHKTDANGVFQIKEGQKAEFEITENAGKYYVRELLSDEIVAQYDQITVSGSSTTISNNVTVGSDTFTGADSPVKDISDGASAFRFDNRILRTELGSLEIKKVFTKYEGVDSSAPKASYEFNVQMSGTAIPVGTIYTVDGTEKTVETAGIIEVPAGKSALISNIVLGTTYSVEEASESSANCYVTYVNANGTIQSETKSKVVVVTNKELGAKIEIPFTKTLTNADGNTHTYNFKIKEIGGSYSDEETVTFESNTGSSLNGKFEIHYLSKEFTEASTTRTYEITEISDGLSNVDFDETVYTVEITIVKDLNTHVITPTLTLVKKNEGIVDTGISFTNTLLTSIQIKKEVSGDLGDRTKAFEFNVTTSMGTFPAEGSGNVGGTFSSYKVNDDGSITVKMTHDQVIELKGLLVGSTLTITEVNATDDDGTNLPYDIKVTRIGSETRINEDNDDKSVDVTLAATNVGIRFINTKNAIPDTGVLLDSLPYVLLLVIALAGVVGFIIHKRKETDLD